VTSNSSTATIRSGATGGRSRAEPGGDVDAAFGPEKANPDAQNAIPVLKSGSGVGPKGDV
jgi:hypothetical protein